jgi:hypothetical protein
LRREIMVLACHGQCYTHLDVFSLRIRTTHPGKREKRL